MRLIGTLEDAKQAASFSSYLLKEGIANTTDHYYDSDQKKHLHRIWIENEDDLEFAVAQLEEFKKQPGNVQFEAPPVSGPEKDHFKIKLEMHPKSPARAYTLTFFLLILCSLIYVWDNYQEKALEKDKGKVAAEISLTPIEQKLFFDESPQMQAIQTVVNTYDLKDFKDFQELPPECAQLLHEAQNVPSWHGVYDYLISPKRPEGPLFNKIREGEVWRLFTPCLLHRDLLHILFNMAWLWMLGRQIEERIGKGRFLVLTLVTGVIANVFQYLMSGPYFLGYSGIVVAMAGFIWMRQKIAPWEGYPLQKATAMFILFFVLAMFGLDLVALLLQISSLTNLSPDIANTAHIVGGLSGMLLARFPFFSRKTA